MRVPVPFSGVWDRIYVKRLPRRLSGSELTYPSFVRVSTGLLIQILLNLKSICFSLMAANGLWCAYTLYWRAIALPLHDIVAGRYQYFLADVNSNLSLPLTVVLTLLFWKNVNSCSGIIEQDELSNVTAWHIQHTILNSYLCDFVGFTGVCFLGVAGMMRCV